MIFEIAGSTNGALIGRFDSKNETKSSIMDIGSDPTTNQPHVYSVGAIASLAVQLKTVAPTLQTTPDGKFYTKYSAPKIINNSTP